MTIPYRVEQKQKKEKEAKTACLHWRASIMDS
jgi:hypothetical protein